MHNAHFCFTQVTQKRLCLSYLCLPFTQAIRVDILCIKKLLNLTWWNGRNVCSINIPNRIFQSFWVSGKRALCPVALWDC